MMAGSAPAVVNRDGLRRSRELFRAFAWEQSDPDRFYRYQAADTVAWFERHVQAPLQGSRLLDVGGGAGSFPAAFQDAGARTVLVEPDAGSHPLPTDRSTQKARHRIAIHAGRLAPKRTVGGDGYHLPFRDGIFDVVFTSNVLEHVRDPIVFLAEMVRVTRPGGTLFVSWNTWYAPNGGHETAPWHYLGGHFAARRYTRVHGALPKNLYGTSLYRCLVGPTLRQMGHLDGVKVVCIAPRYHPHWLWWLIRVPVVREFATWNAVVVLRRDEE